MSILFWAFFWSLADRNGPFKNPLKGGNSCQFFVGCLPTAVFDFKPLKQGEMLDIFFVGAFLFLSGSKLDLSGSKRTIPAPKSIEFGAGNVHLEPERPILEPERGKKHPQKNCQAFPLVLRGKNRTMRSTSSQQKIDKSFPPSGVLKWAIPIGKRPEKHPPTKMCIVLPLLQGKNRRYLSHVRRTLVWGLNKFTKNSPKQSRPNRICFKGCRTETRSVGCYWECP